MVDFIMNSEGCAIKEDDNSLSAGKSIKILKKYFQRSFKPACLAHFLWNCTEMDVNNLEATLVLVMAWYHQATNNYLNQF